MPVHTEKLVTAGLAELHLDSGKKTMVPPTQRMTAPVGAVTQHLVGLVDAHCLCTTLLLLAETAELRTRVSLIIRR